MVAMTHVKQWLVVTHEPLTSIEGATVILDDVDCDSYFDRVEDLAKPGTTAKHGVVIYDIDEQSEAYIRFLMLGMSRGLPITLLYATKEANPTRDIQGIAEEYL